MVDFKRKLIESFIGPKILSVVSDAPIHQLIRSNTRLKCAYCALFSRTKQTRYKCGADCCGMPLCSMGTGRADKDCFSLSHENEQI